MSGEAMKWARQQNLHSATLKAVVNVIAARVGPNGTTFASQATLAADANMGERTMRRHLAVLATLGVIKRQVRSKGRKGRITDLITLSLHRTFDLSAMDVREARKAPLQAKPAPLQLVSNRPLCVAPTGQQWPGNNRGITWSYQEGSHTSQGKGYTREAGARFRVVGGLALKPLHCMDGGEADF